MATTLDTLVVELVLNSSAFAAQSKGVEKALNGIKTAAQATGLVVAAMFVKSGIAQFVSQAQELGNLSRSVRENAEDLQAWGEAVKREGGTVEGFNSTVKKLSDDLMSIPLTGGNSPLLGGLTRLGVQFRNLDGSMRKPLDLLKDLSSRFQGMSNAQSLALGKKLGLDEATIRLLQKGRKGLDELLVKYKELGVMSNEDIKTGERLKKMFQDYHQVLTALGMRFIRFFLPAAEKVSQWLMTAARWVQQHGRAVEAGIIAISTAIAAYLIPSLYKLVANPVLLGLTALAGAIFLIIEDFMAWKEGADSALGPVYEWLSKISDWISQNIGWLELLGRTLVALALVDMGRFIYGLHSVTAAFVAQHAIASRLLATLTAIVLAWKAGKKAGEWFFNWTHNQDYEGKGAYELMRQGKGKSTMTPEQLARARAMLAEMNGNAQAIQSQQVNNNRSIDNSRSFNQQAHIDKVIVNNPSGSFTETMNGVASSSPVASSIQSDTFTGG